uniref:TraB domain-containing protein n=1 Tax=Pseudictyota dubia TaxID=2749911 RepID=A0A7R9ZAD2_9STRA
MAKTNPPQLVEFVEPKTKTKVLLIGTMHYNPTSIKQVEDTIDDLAQSGRLGSVVVESCEVRWNTTMEILNTPRGQFLKPVLTSEMKAASDKAVAYNRPVVLGDQLINVTGTSLSAALKSTVVDLASPLNGGWKRFYNDVKQAAELALPTGPGYLTPRSFFDPKLLIAAPVSFAKYPLSFLARNPVSTAAVLAVLFGLSRLDTGSAFADATFQEQALSVVESLVFATLEFALLGRVMVQVLLAERNVVLAKNILSECEIYSKSRENNEDGVWSSLLNMFTTSSFFNTEQGLDRILQTSRDTFYIPSRSVYSESIERDNTKKKESEDKVVVAVLGMAHCNGIQKLLREQLV